MQAVKKDINSGQVCYAGKTLTWSDKADKKKKIDAKKSILNTMAGDRSKLCDKNKGIFMKKISLTILFEAKR